MRISQLVSCLHPVKSGSTHAIYSHVAALTNIMVKAGHHVDLFASGDSHTKGVLHSVNNTSLVEQQLTNDIKRHYFNLLISNCYEHAKNTDIIHSHFTLLSSFYAKLTPSVPTITSFHSPIRDEIRPFLSKYKDLSYVSFSHAQRAQMPELNWVANIYHGIDTKRFAFEPIPKDYFLYLGRVTEEKGIHLAIEAAEAANVPLIIAGGSYQNEGYWHTHIQPKINGKTIRYVGEADQEQKIELLQGAKALLFPTQYDETFGLVMAEAMSCGTPVIGWRNGSVPEVISDRRTGYIIESVQEMVQAIQAIDKIDRKTTRNRAKTYFSQQKMAQGYLHVYERMIEENKKALKDKTKTK